MLAAILAIVLMACGDKETEGPKCSELSNADHTPVEPYASDLV